jgi:hypothetical protein
VDSRSSNIDTKQYPEFDSEILKDKLWKLLEEKKLKAKFKIYIGNGNNLYNRILGIYWMGSIFNMAYVAW